MTQAQFTIEEIPFFNPIKIANSGQCFRWKILDASHVELVALGRYLQIAYLGSERFAFSCPRSEFNDLWYNYLDLARDYHQVADCILPDDTYLREALAFGEGIRILNQDPFETLICFIISQRRSIPSITTCVERLCALAGRKIDLPLASLESQELFVNLPEENYFAFPNCEEILKLTPEQLDSIGAGYRKEYILRASLAVFSNDANLQSWSNLSDESLFENLTSLYGVGKKVANCVMLFAYARSSRFPIDVWVQRIIDKYYGGSYDINRYPSTAGIMQQLMFYYERNKSIT